MDDAQVTGPGSRGAAGAVAGGSGVGRLVAIAKLFGGGGLAWLRGARDGLAAIRVAVGAAALSTGVLDALRDGPASTAALRARLGLDDRGLLDPWLRVLQAHHLIRAAAGTWLLTRRGQRLVDDDMLRAASEGFSGYHTGLYRELAAQLHGGPPRRDIAEHGATIAQISRAMEPVLQDLLKDAVRSVRPARVLDVGCGAGQNLAAMLAAASEAEGTGIEIDEGVADLAEQLLGQRDLLGRARVIRGDVATLAAEGAAGGPYDLVLLANVVYYLPLPERVPLFRAVAGLLSGGGTLLVATTAATPDPFSRHFDLLLRAQGQGMELPDTDELSDQLAQAGLRPGPARALAPGAPLIVVEAKR